MIPPGRFLGSYSVFALHGRGLIELTETDMCVGKLQNVAGRSSGRGHLNNIKVMRKHRRLSFLFHFAFVFGFPACEGGDGPAADATIEDTVEDDTGEGEALCSQLVDFTEDCYTQTVGRPPSSDETQVWLQDCESSPHSEDCVRCIVDTVPCMEYLTNQDYSISVYCEDACP